jgi:hypothetical protein
MEEVLGGSSMATTRFLKACPNRAIASSHPRPQFLGSMEATTILTRGEVHQPDKTKKELLASLGRLRHDVAHKPAFVEAHRFSSQNCQKLNQLYIFKGVLAILTHP